MGFGVVIGLIFGIAIGQFLDLSSALNGVVSPGAEASRTILKDQRAGIGPSRGWDMTYQIVADTPVASTGAVYFVGPGTSFSRVVLRTVETELDGPTQRVPDLEAVRFARMAETGAVKPAYMVVVHESAARALFEALRKGADELPDRRLAIAFEDEDTACALFADICDELLEWGVSLLPMDTNVTNWVRLLQVIQAGGYYVPPTLLQKRTETWATAAGPHPAVDTPVEPAARDGLTPREAEVLAMAADGRPNKMIAGELALSEHTVKPYMHRIIGMLGVKNRTEAAVWYHQNARHV